MFISLGKKKYNLGKKSNKCHRTVHLFCSGLYLSNQDRCFFIYLQMQAFFLAHMHLGEVILLAFS